MYIIILKTAWNEKGHLVPLERVAGVPQSATARERTDRELPGHVADVEA